ncbi:LANO_0D00914g1_1 [Lachancea nothofagi CBS 11611]|uniref:LANO_0D00914g1_1 n=1 Tax=Lachancea nothofagi CBS 11611 TaxID=1266666 RepID=A0A1G4JD26_9SACH|nr:LANO_0D00914g1_1 [Lachancea nothofagi CBS 11611]
MYLRDSTEFPMKSQLRELSELLFMDRLQDPISDSRASRRSVGESDVIEQPSHATDQAMIGSLQSTPGKRSLSQAFNLSPSFKRHKTVFGELDIEIHEEQDSNPVMVSVASNSDQFQNGLQDTPDSEPRTFTPVDGANDAAEELPIISQSFEDFSFGNEERADHVVLESHTSNRRRSDSANLVTEGLSLNSKDITKVIKLCLLPKTFTNTHEAINKISAFLSQHTSALVHQVVLEKNVKLGSSTLLSILRGHYLISENSNDMELYEFCREHLCIEDLIAVEMILFD